MTDPQGAVHRTHPFAAPEELRDPARQLRGRLASPVTVWTSGDLEAPTGFTVSSLIVAEGPPPTIFGLVSINSDLWDVLQATERFVVHVLDESGRVMADIFAGLRPAPGGAFTGLKLEPSEWGPVIADVPSRAYCRFDDATAIGHHRLVRGTVERIDLGDLLRPLVYFRGGYRGLQVRDR